MISTPGSQALEVSTAAAATGSRLRQPLMQIFTHDPMGKIKAIASTLANVWLAALDEMRRHRRRAKNFRLLTRHSARQPFPQRGGRLRFARMPGQGVTFLQPGTRMQWRAQPAAVRVSLFR